MAVFAKLSCRLTVPKSRMMSRIKWIMNRVAAVKKQDRLTTRSLMLSDRAGVSITSGKRESKIGRTGI